MQWLTATLAFATTMLFFAVVVSTLVEIYHRFVGLREKGLELMLQSLFERVVKPQLTSARLDPNIDAKQFAAIIMANRAVASDKHSDVLNAKVETAQAAVDAAKADAKKDPEAAKAAKAALVKAEIDLAAAKEAAKVEPSPLNRLLRWGCCQHLR